MESDDKYNKFLEWLVKNGSILENTIYPVSFNHTIGVMSNKDIGPNEAIFYIPRKLIIDSNSVENKLQDFLKRHDILKTQNLYDSQIILLTIFMVFEDFNDESFFRPYLEIAEDPCLPVFWEPQDLIEIQNDSLIDQIMEDKIALKSIYNVIKDIMKEELNNNFVSKENYEKFTYDYFSKWYSFCLTRNFYLDEKTSCLIPFADNLNHSHVDIKYEIFDSENLITKFTLQDDHNSNSESLFKTSHLLFIKNTNHDLNHEKLNIFKQIQQNSFKDKLNDRQNYNINYIDEDDENEEEFEETNLQDKTEVEQTNLNYTDRRRMKKKYLQRENDSEYSLLNQNDYFLISTGNSQIYQEGEQIFNCYGKFSNEYLLVWYGFTYLNNPFNKTQIKFKILKSKAKSLFGYLKFVIPKNFKETSKFYSLSFKIRINSINEELMKYGLFFVFYEIDRLDKYLTYSYDKEIELKSLDYVSEVIKKAILKKFKLSSIENDLNELKNLDQSHSRLKFALIYRIEIKKILVQELEIINLLKDLIKIVDSETMKIQIPSKFSQITENKQKIIKQYFDIRKIQTEFSMV